MLEVMKNYWPIALFTFLLTLVLVLVALKVFPKLGLMDRPEKYSLQRAPIPYYGGILLYFAFVISVLCFVDLTISVMGLLIGATLIAVIGFLDDYFRLKPITRLFWQFCAGVVLVISGIYVFSINLPFFGMIDFNKLIVYGIPLVAALFTVFWSMTIVNAMNFVDGVSGLSSGVTFIAAFSLFVLSIHPGIHEDPSSQMSVATISLIVAMIALAFLIFDFPKPKILMGDSGSTFFGFLIATLAIFSGGKVATAFLVLGIVVLDMIWVVGRRVLSGQKFWKGDLKHLHHRLLYFGLSERKVVFLYLFITALFGIFSVVFVNTNQKFFIMIALVILMLVLAGALIFSSKRK